MLVGLPWCGQAIDEEEGLSTLYIDHAGLRLEKDGGSLVVRDPSGTLLQRIPMGPLQRVILQGDIQLHSGLLLALAKAGIEVILFGGRDSQSIVHCLGPTHGDGHRRLAQYVAVSDPEKRLSLARWVLRAKLHAQRQALFDWQRHGLGEPRLLRQALASWPELHREISSATMDALLGIEGKAAARYFPAFFSTLPKPFQVTSRVRRPPKDPTNALLSLAYTLLHHEAIHVAYGQGLDPYLGALHQPSYGRESLACDLVEPLRSRVDTWICQQLREGVLRPEYFYTDRGAVFLGKAGRQRFYRAWMHEVPHLRRRLRRLGRLAWRLVDPA